jgi:hemoglobin
VTDIAGPPDVERLLKAFYGQALVDDQLGPVFAASGMDLVTHLPRIAAFWEVSLLHTGDYTGRPMQLHRRLTETSGLLPEMFDRWLEIWHRTVDALFAGPVAEQAKTDAVRMAAGMRGALADELAL